MIKKEFTFAVFFMLFLGSVTYAAHWADGISKNEKAAFCNFYSSLENLLTSLQLGEKPEGFKIAPRDKDKKKKKEKKKVKISEQERRDFQEKWDLVAREKNLNATLKLLYSICLNETSSPEGHKNCKKFVDYYKKQRKEELLAVLVMLKKKNEASGKNYKLKNQIGLVPYRDK